jgi:hypothetical protein
MLYACLELHMANTLCLAHLCCPALPCPADIPKQIAHIPTAISEASGAQSQLLPDHLSFSPPLPHPLSCTASAPHVDSCILCARLIAAPDRCSACPPLCTAAAGAAGATILTHDLFTNDVLYLDVALDMRPLARDLLPLVPLFCR